MQSHSQLPTIDRYCRTASFVMPSWLRVKRLLVSCVVYSTERNDSRTSRIVTIAFQICVFLRPVSSAPGLGLECSIGSRHFTPIQKSNTRCDRATSSRTEQPVKIINGFVTHRNTPSTPRSPGLGL